jgi:hypothetical protein
MTFSEFSVYLPRSEKTGPLCDFGEASPATSRGFSRQRLPSILGTKEHCWIIAAVFTSAVLLLSCSTALVNENTLNIATTTDDLTTRQIIFNLVKIKQSAFALPSQVQITGGNVAALTSITPSVATVPLAPMIATTLSGSTTSATVTNSNAVTRPAATSGLSAIAQNTDTWDTTFLQDPEQLRRLQYLYQYGAHQIPLSNLLCTFPIPETTGQKPQSQQIKRRYVRVLNVGPTFASPCPSAAASNAVFLIGDDPDIAFLRYPNCILCAVPLAGWSDWFKQTVRTQRLKIYPNVYVGEPEQLSDKSEYVPTLINSDLLPNAVLMAPTTGKRSWVSSAQEQMIDWMSIVRDGGENIPNDAKRIGGLDGYSVYVYPVSPQGNEQSGDRHFSNFVLAILEALQEPRELQTVSPQPPPVVRTH